MITSMERQDLQKDIVEDEKVSVKLVTQKMRLIAGLKLRFKNLFKKMILKLRLKLKALLSRMKKIFILQEEEKLQRKLAKQPAVPSKNEIPSVLKDVADLDSKVDLFLQNHHGQGVSKVSVDYTTVERVKAEDTKKKSEHDLSGEEGGLYVCKHLERKTPIDRLSAHSIDLITTEILKHHKVKSFIERELSKNSSGGADLVIAI